MILHLDGDSFFASCELLRRRDLLGTPVVVGEERGIATAMNAEAKRIGIERGEPIHLIKKKYGNTVAIIPSHFDLYRHIASATYQILLRFTTAVEAYSIDECFIDFSHIADSELEMRTRQLQDTLHQSLGLWYSCGVARTKALAKIASKRNKPQGICIVRKCDETHLLATTAIENVWGIGRRLAPRLRRIGVTTAQEFRDKHTEDLGDINTKVIRELQSELRGHTRILLHTKQVFQKSVETTRAFGFSTTDVRVILSEFSKNIETVCDRMIQLGVVGRYAYFFIRTGLNHARIYGETPLPFFTDDAIAISEVVMPYFRRLLHTKIPCKGTGISIAQCVPKHERNHTLFEIHEDPLVRAQYSYRDTQSTVKKIRDTHGVSSLMLGSSMRAYRGRTRARDARDKRDNYVYGLPLPYLGEI